MKKIITATLIMFGFLFSSGANPLEVGKSSPAIQATTSEGASLDLGDFLKEGVTLVYFYPKADTPGCTAQACNLRDAFEEISDAGIRVIGVSRDTVSSQAAFKEKYNLPFVLLADEDGAVTEAFGVPTRMGFASRQSFLIKDGVIVWRDLSASPRSQAQDALKAYQTSQVNEK